MGRNVKPVAKYYPSLNYDLKSIQMMQDSFEMVTSSLRDKEVEVLFLPRDNGFDTAYILNAFPNLKIIASNTTATPYLDEVKLLKHGTKVVSLEGQIPFLDNITPVAELTIAFMVMMTRNLFPSIKDVKSWDRYLHPGDKMLSRMSLGIVGLGRIGKHVAKRAKAMGLRVGYYDPRVESEYTRYHNLTSLLKSSDMVTIHADLNHTTNNLFNSDTLFNMRPGSYLINTARGSIVDTWALIDALDTGHIAGAALDVLAEEEYPLRVTPPLHDNLIITPHIGGSTKDAWLETQLWVIRKVVEYWREQYD